MASYSVIEIGIIDGHGDLRIGAGYHLLGTDRVFWRTQEGAWKESRLDPRGDSKVLANLDFYDDLDHAERIFLGPWPKANRIADEAGAPAHRTMLHNNAVGEILLGNRFELCCYRDGCYRVVVFHKQGHIAWSAKFCSTEQEAVTTLRDFLALRGEH